jgi:hypothetical protein
MQTPAEAKRAIEDELRLHDVSGYTVTARVNEAQQPVAQP